MLPFYLPQQTYCFEEHDQSKLLLFGKLQDSEENQEQLVNKVNLSKNQYI